MCIRSSCSVVNVLSVFPGRWQPVCDNLWVRHSRGEFWLMPQKASPVPAASVWYLLPTKHPSERRVNSGTAMGLNHKSLISDAILASRFSALGLQMMFGFILLSYQVVGLSNPFREFYRSASTLGSSWICCYLYLILMGKVLCSEQELIIYLYNQTSVGTTLILVTIALPKSVYA